ncbi:MAG: hypothetical protein L3J20_12475 [Flavobacteriaceae bacterium]|nr:hypothetical protein [Flavobacteriaceae bacterium]
MRKVLVTVLLTTLMIQCKKENNYLLAKEQVGKITSTTEVYELKSIFEKDSLVSHLGEGDFADSSYDEYLVYTKDGGHIFTIIPKEQQDSTSTIESIQVFGKKYKTIKGLGLSSTFKDISGNYTVDKVESTFNNAVLFVDELNATITITKKELGVNDFGTQKISLAQIPDLAKIKALTFWFD